MVSNLGISTKTWCSFVFWSTFFSSSSSSPLLLSCFPISPVSRFLDPPPPLALRLSPSYFVYALASWRFPVFLFFPRHLCLCSHFLPYLQLYTIAHTVSSLPPPNRALYGQPPRCTLSRYTQLAYIFVSFSSLYLTLFTSYFTFSASIFYKLPRLFSILQLLPLFFFFPYISPPSTLTFLTSHPTFLFNFFSSLFFVFLNFSSVLPLCFSFPLSLSFSRLSLIFSHFPYLR